MTVFRVSRQSGGGKLNSAERKLLAAVVPGALADFNTGRTPGGDPSGAERWGRGRTLRAGLLARLLTGDLATEGGQPRAVQLRGARITGSLDLKAATLTCPLLLWDCRIDEPVSFDEVTAPAIRMLGCQLPGLTAVSQLRTAGDLVVSAAVFTRPGEIQLDGARIGGSVILNDVTFANPGGTALNADGLTVEQNMIFGGGFTAEGEVRLAGAKIGGSLGLLGVTLTNPGRIAMSAHGLAVGRNMSGDGLTAEGEILLFGATIGGDLNLRDARLASPGRTALTADRITVGQGMHMDTLNSAGEVRLPGAHISGQLTLTGAKLDNPDGAALYAAQLTVDSDMSCAGLSAAGAISLDGAHVGERLSFTGAELTGPGVLTAAGLTVARDFYCNLGFTAACEVSLPGASIGGELNFNGARLANESGVALDIEGATIQALLMPQDRPLGTVNFTNAKVGVLADYQDSWPDVLCLRGFTYDSFGNQDVSTRARLQWLKRHPGRFTPQVYDQLAAVYRSAGDDRAARKVAVAKQWRRRRAFDPLNWLWYATVGYGYRTWLAGIWLLALAGLGTWIFTRAYPAHMTAISDHRPAFHAVAYALDLLLPVVGLGEKSGWQPNGSAVLYWSWTLTAAGWILTTAVVAGLTGLLKRD